MRAISTLPQRFPHLWPDTAPASLPELCDAQVADLRTLAAENGWGEDTLTRVLDTRRDAIDATHAGAKMSLNSPATLRRMFDQGTLRAPTGKWLTYALDAHRQRLLVPTPSGDMRYVWAITDIVPDAAWLGRKVPLPDDGAWLLIFGGCPTWVKPAQATRLAELVADGRVVDVVYRHLRKGEPPVTYSTRARCGTVGTTAVDWPT